MSDRSPELTAAVRAVRGESDLDVVMPALENRILAWVIACAPDTDPLVRAVAALCGELTGLLDPPTRAEPTLHDAMAHLIGTPAGWHALRTWTAVAPADWGRAHAEALIDAVHSRQCDAWVAAALIGPGDRSAALLTQVYGIASVIRHWGESDAAAPTAWADALSAGERWRLIDEVLCDSFSFASCIPWLPPDVANRRRIDDDDLDAALDAYAAASPVARASHTAFLQRLVARARPANLDDLTRLACAMQEDDIWRRVQTLVRDSPDDAWRVVAAAPWDDLPQEVRATLLTCADQSDVCAAIAAARSNGKPMAPSPLPLGIAFFAALNPAVWDALDAEAQQRWRRALWRADAHLAVRSLGLRPDILERTVIDDVLACTARQHARNEAALRAALLPVALRDPAIDQSYAAYALIAAMPTPPPDPSAFFFIAGGGDDPARIVPARVALRSSDDLSLAVMLQRCADADARMPHVCTVLRDALRGRSHDDLMPFMSLLDADARAVLMPDADALVARLAHPDRQDALRQTLARLAFLPPEVAIPTRVALTRWTPRSARDAAEALAHVLHAHGDVVLELADALADEHLRQALLPLPKDAALADALRALARDDPPTAQRLAHALRDGDWKNVIRLAPSLPQWARNAIPPHADDLVVRLARPDGRDKLRAALQQLASAPPDVDIPARCALDRLATKNADVWDAAQVLAHAMRNVGDAFLSIMDALADDDLRQTLLPLPEDAALATALRDLARDDPPSARYLADAILKQDRRAALLALLTASPRPAAAVWQALSDAMRRAIGDAMTAAPPDADPLAERDPLAARALAAVQSTDADVRNAGVTALANRSALVRAVWEQLSPEVRQILGALPAFADLPQTPKRPVIRRGRLVRRRS